jgi:hypothetical protein
MAAVKFPQTMAEVTPQAGAHGDEFPAAQAVGRPEIGKGAKPGDLPAKEGQLGSDTSQAPVGPEALCKRAWLTRSWRPCSERAWAPAGRYRIRVGGGGR